MYDTTDQKISFKIFLAIRNTVYFLIRITNKIFKNKKPKVVIYCYHSIGADGWRFSVTKDNFEKQINYLLERQDAFSVEDLQDYINGNKKLERDSFLITFDDGYKDVLEVKGFLKSKDIKPVMFAIGDSGRADRSELETARPFLNTVEMEELINAGWTIGSHSNTHKDFNKISPSEAEEEVVGSKSKLESDLGIEIKYFAYPKGRYNDMVLSKVAEVGYDLAFSVDDGYITPGMDKLTIPRVGVDGTHTMEEFRSLALPLSMLFRKIIKNLF